MVGSGTADVSKITQGAGTLTSLVAQLSLKTRSRLEDDANQDGADRSGPKSLAYEAQASTSKL